MRLFVCNELELFATGDLKGEKIVLTFNLFIIILNEWKHITPSLTTKNFKVLLKMLKSLSYPALYVSISEQVCACPERSRKRLEK